MATVPRVHLLDLPAGHEAWARALPVLQELRTALTADLLAQVLREGQPQGLRFLGAFDAGRPDDGSCPGDAAAAVAGGGGQACLGVAGWRVVASTSTVRKLYVDDLVTTSAARSRGVGGALLDELERRARQAGCSVLDLDSGVQRHDAHRFYLRRHMDITSHHLVRRW